VHPGIKGSRALVRSSATVVARSVVIALLLASSTTDAQNATDAAREHYRRGTAAYNLGRYQEAAQEYERAYEDTLDPALLFNVAQAYRLAGERKKAVIAYRSYLRDAPEGEKRQTAEAKLRETEAALNFDDPFLEDKKAAPNTHPSSGLETMRPAPPPPAPPNPPPENLSLAIHETSSAAQPPAVSATEPERRTTPPSSSAFYERWPFWAAAGGVVGVLIVVVAVSVASSNAAPKTDLGTMRF
jgi:tetratricopeptide (TPR) repeat protein